jgi:hypothetical protein
MKPTTAIVLKRDRRLLGLSLHGWENAMVVFLIVAGFFALIAGAATWAVVRLQRIEISASKGEFERYKVDAATELGAARADADAKIANANKTIAEARAETAKALAETAAANKQTAELKLALEREIAARQPRTIKSEQREQILSILRSDSAPKGDVIVLWKLFDEEAEQFGKQVLSLLKDAGFNAKAENGPMSFSVRGAWIVVRDLTKFDHIRTAIGTVQSAFRRVLDIELAGQQRKDSFPDLGEIVIAIGPKPF